ncbi:MAG: hypothetical protein GTO76_12945 [Planctomycetales bacterium]|nr:hypothetical protein [Planctomycetales bacterium]NIO35822.1 hypothetical protein [Planctomycetales bacterium]NIO47573.1 hypothetical protein [Planctomycetales bacterium]NIP05695.1 hypothetical protein [Planctomycetales bacterium]
MTARHHGWQSQPDLPEEGYGLPTCTSSIRQHRGMPRPIWTLLVTLQKNG